MTADTTSMDPGHAKRLALLLRRIGLCLALLWCARLLYHFHLATSLGLTRAGTLAFGDDTISFWAAARLALQGRIADVYDFARFHDFQVAVLGGPIHVYRYNYPPAAVLLTLPLGLLPYLAAVVFWLAGGWMAFAAAVRAPWPGTAHKGTEPILYALAVPAFFVNTATGQTGTWIAALFGGGLTLLGRAPVLGGILLGLLAAKPQTALLIPCALLAARRWSSLVACGATAAVLIAVSTAIFGMEIWWAFASSATRAREWDLEDGAGVWQIQTSVFALIRHFPAPLTVAYTAQALAALLALILVWRVWRSQAPQSRKNALLVIASVFATPYVNVYDLVVTALVPLWMAPLTISADDPARAWALSACALLLMVPIIAPPFAEATGLGIGILLLVPAFWLCARRADKTV